MNAQYFGPYRVTRPLGQGGMGMVYEAVNPQTGQVVAIKTLPSHLASSDAARQRFQSEIKVLMDLQHPGIARMSSFGEENGVPFFAMEFVPGHSLEQLLRAGRRFSWRDTAAVAREMLPALKYAHDHGVVHRDLKPANLMFPPAVGGGYNVKLTDFGIAKVFGETGQTRSGLVIGTPDYMAPEQAAGQAVDERADLYCLGLVMFAMMTGAPPFASASAEEILERQRTEPAPRLSKRVADVPAKLDELIAKLLDKVPANRPASAAAVARLLAEITAPVAEPTPRPAMPPAVTQSMTTAAAGRRAATVRVDAASAQATTVGIDPTGGGEASAWDARHLGRTSFTTVESVSRDRQTRARRSQVLRTVSGLVASIAAMAGVGLLVWMLLKPPSPEQRWQELLAVMQNPDDLRDPCGLVRAYLTAHPAGPHAEDVRRLGEQIALERLAKRSRRRLPTYSAKSDAERLYLEGLQFTSTDPAEAKRSLTRLAGLAGGGGDSAGKVATDPCMAVERPSLAMWKDLAQRQLAIVEPLIHEDRTLEREEKQAESERAKAMLEQASRYQREAETTTDATRRVIAITWRHRLLEDLIEAFADKPHTAETVAEARRLLDAVQ